MQIEVEGSFSPDDLKQIARISLQPFRPLYYAFVVAILVAPLFLLVTGEPLNSIVDALPLLLVPPLILVVLLFWVIPQMHIRGTRKNRDMVEAVRHVRITDDAYVLRSQTETQTSLVEWKWDRFKRFREDENAFCFHLRGGTGGTFEYLPKHWLKDHQVDELRSFLRSAIASGK